MVAAPLPFRERAQLPFPVPAQEPSLKRVARQASWRDHLRSLTNRFRAAGLDDADSVARALILAWGGMSDLSELWGAGPAGVLWPSDDGPAALAQAERLEAWARRAQAGESVARIAGTKSFWSLDFALGPDTLEPRPDSEVLVEAALDLLVRKAAGKPAQDARPLAVLDLGVGTGALLLSVLDGLKRSGCAATGLGVDCAPGALRTAQSNARALKLDEQVSWACGSWLDPLASDLCAGRLGPFDLVICNPPYVAEQDWAALSPRVRDFDPPCALLGGEDGLQAYRDLACQLSDLAPFVFGTFGRSGGPGESDRKTGRDAPGVPLDLLLEIGDGQAHDVERIFADCAFRLVATFTDLTGRPRALGFSSLPIIKPIRPIRSSRCVRPLFACP